MHKTVSVVISNEERDLAFSATYEEKISRLWLEMTIATQSRRGGGNILHGQPTVETSESRSKAIERLERLER